MRHRMHPLLSAPTGGSSHYRARGRYLWRKETRLCRAEYPPHFLFVLPKRKRAGHGTKEKALRDELPGKAVNSPKTGGWPSQTADQIQKSPTGCAIPIPPGTVSPHQKVRRTPMFQTGRPLPFFPLPLPRPTPGGVSKGEGPQSRPFVPRGGMGDGWRPPCFGWGSKGEGPLRQRPLPLAP